MRSHCILNALEDGHWWIKWVGKISMPKFDTKKKTPEIAILAEELPPHMNSENICVDAILNNKNAKSQWMKIGVGSIPNLIIGGIYINGVLVDQLFHTEIPITIPLNEMILCKATSSIPGAPDWWSPSIPFQALAKNEYPLGKENLDAPMYVFSYGANTYILSCYEVFRTLFGPTSAMARALLSGTWDEGIQELINPDKSSLDENGLAKTVVRQGVSLEYSPVLTNICLTEYGRRCSNEIFVNRQNSSFIQARVPFESEQLKIKAKVICLRKSINKHLITQITSVTWPKDYVIKNWMHTREISNEKGENIKPGGGQKPFSGTPMPTPPDGEPPRVIEGEDPDDFGPETIIAAPSIQWDNFPKPTKLPKETSTEYENSSQMKPPKATPEVSTGSPKSNGSQTAKADIRSDLTPEMELSDEMSNIELFVISLKDDPEIDSVCKILPETCTMLRSGESVWPARFGYAHKNKQTKNSGKTPDIRYSKWSYFDDDKTIFRCAKIYKIEVKEKNDTFKSAYWIEIEKRERERGYCAFIMKRKDNDYAENTDFTEALRIIAENRGNSALVSSMTEWKSKNLKIAHWVHNRNTKGELSRKTAVNTILSVLNLPQKKTTKNRLKET